MAVLFKQPRGQVHRDVTHLDRHTHLHDPPGTHLCGFQGLAGRLVSAHKGPGHITHYNAGKYIPLLQCVFFVTGFPKYHNVHENSHGDHVYSHRVSKLEE